MLWWQVAIRLLIAVLVGCLVGIEREKKNRPAGMRTHVLVSVGAAVIAILECYMVEETVALNLLNPTSGINVARGRLVVGIVSGIGFLGAGTIFVTQKKIAGLTTAASLWNVGCLGMASGLGYYGLSLFGCLIVLITLNMLQKVVKVNSVKNV